MSAFDPYRPQTQVGPHRVFVDPPPDPASEVPGHPDEVLTWMRQPGGDLAERARRVDLVEEVEMGRPGRMRDVVIDAVRWNRAVITGEVEDGDDSWAGFDSTEIDGPPVDVADLPVDVTSATLNGDGTVTVEGTMTDEQAAEVVDGLPDGAEGEAVEADAADEKPAKTYSADDVPSNAKDIVTWIQGAPDETDAAERSQAAWLVEIDRSSGVRATVRAEIDKHLD